MGVGGEPLIGYAMVAIWGRFVAMVTTCKAESVTFIKIKHPMKASFFWMAGAAMALVACDGGDGPEPVPVTLTFNLEVNGEPLSLGSDLDYVSEDGLLYSIHDFKVYLSQLALTTAEGAYEEPDSYHLLAPGADQAQVQLVLSEVPGGVYQGLRLAVGVDSAANRSLDQRGDLNPSNQMAWNWNTGYKFVLLEGEFQQGDSLRPLVFHIGLNSNYAKQVLPFGGDLDLTEGKGVTLTFTLDIGELFRNPNTIAFAETNNLKFEPETAQVAENWLDSFIQLEAIQLEP